MSLAAYNGPWSDDDGTPPLFGHVMSLPSLCSALHRLLEQLVASRCLALKILNARRRPRQPLPYFVLQVPCRLKELLRDV